MAGICANETLMEVLSLLNTFLEPSVTNLAVIAGFALGLGVLIVVIIWVRRRTG